MLTKMVMMHQRCFMPSLLYLRDTIQWAFLEVGILLKSKGKKKAKLLFCLCSTDDRQSSVTIGV